MTLKIVPVAPIITGITFIFTFPILCISLLRSLYLYLLLLLLLLLNAWLTLELEVLTSYHMGLFNDMLFIYMAPNEKVNI